jgi:hypothetical protein
VRFGCPKAVRCQETFSYLRLPHTTELGLSGCFHCRARRSRRDPFWGFMARLSVIAIFPLTCTHPDFSSNFCA